VFKAVIGILGLDPKSIFNSFSPYGEVVAWFIVFAETGLLLGFFLPGDSLLFTAGILAGQNKLSIWLLLPGAFVGAFLGAEVGYLIGRRVGPRLFRRPDSRFFKQEYVERTREFFDRHGPQAVVLARFVPVVRTFTPVMAGVGEMRRRDFTRYNLIGALLWAVGVTMLGYALGNAIGNSIDTYLLPLIALIIAISLIPVYVEWRRAKRGVTRSSDEGEPGSPTAPVGDDRT
jgi:membrane-associated protein